jgi:hypothetical protein
VEEQQVMQLLRTVERCRRELRDIAERFRLDHDFPPETYPDHRFHIPYDDGPARLVIGAGMMTRIDPSDIRWIGDDIDAVLTVEAADPGLVVASRFAVYCSAPMGEFPEGDHILFERRSGVLTFDEAMDEADRQLDGFRDLEPYAARLGLARR